MIKLYLIRHGRQNSSLCNVDVPLDEAGIRQAELVGHRLKKYDIEALYSSNLIRARQTAEIIGKELNLVNSIEENLKEISFGDLEGLDDVQIKEKFGDYLMDISKYVFTAVIITTIFGEMVSKPWLLYLVGIVCTMVTLLIALFYLYK